MSNSLGELLPIIRLHGYHNKFGISVPRDVGREYRHKGCGSSLGIFNFLIFLVYLLALIQDVMIDVVTNIMINGQSVTIFQASITYSTICCIFRLLLMTFSWELPPLIKKFAEK